jgi:hypothetical protein
MAGDENIMISYAGHIVRTMWAYGGPAAGDRRALQYDCRRDGGASAYGMIFDGSGTFQLSAFLARERSTCNCYDLAAILQVCCQALGKKPDPDQHLTDPTEEVREIPVSPVFFWNGPLAWVLEQSTHSSLHLPLLLSFI